MNVNDKVRQGAGQYYRSAESIGRLVASLPCELSVGGKKKKKKRGKRQKRERFGVQKGFCFWRLMLQQRAAVWFWFLVFLCLQGRSERSQSVSLWRCGPPSETEVGCVQHSPPRPAKSSTKAPRPTRRHVSNAPGSPGWLAAARAGHKQQNTPVDQ